MSGALLAAAETDPWASGWDMLGALGTPLSDSLG